MSPVAHDAPAPTYGDWCANNSAYCPTQWWCSPSGFLVTTVALTGAWGLCYLALSRIVFPVVEGALRRLPSTDKDESTASWFAWHVQSTLHASVVFGMAFGSTLRLSAATEQVHFGVPVSASHLADLQSIGLAAHIFLCYIIMDYVVAYSRGSLTRDYFIHHTVFLAFTTLVMYHCFAVYLAGWLLLMEFSTIPLNFFSFFQKRLGNFHLFVKGMFLLFGAGFVVFRLGGMSYITWLFCSAVFRDGATLFSGIPRTHLQFLCGCLVAAQVLQFYWAVTITGTVVKTLSPAQPNGDTHKVS